jgi:hypothetical protein
MSRRRLPAPAAGYAQDALFDLAAPAAAGPRGFPLCGECGGEAAGPGSRWCYRHWTPGRDPDGAAIARRLGLLPPARAAA